MVKQDLLHKLRQGSIVAVYKPKGPTSHDIFYFSTFLNDPRTIRSVAYYASSLKCGAGKKARELVAKTFRSASACGSKDPCYELPSAGNAGLVWQRIAILLA